MADCVWSSVLMMNGSHRAAYRVGQPGQQNAHRGNYIFSHSFTLMLDLNRALWSTLTDISPAQAAVATAQEPDLSSCCTLEWCTMVHVQ